MDTSYRTKQMPQANKKSPVVRLLIIAVPVAIAVLGAKLLSSTNGPASLGAAAVGALSKGDSIVSVRDDGRRALHVFVSADCSYCKRLEPELSELRDVTIYRHLLPGHDAGGRKLALDVWCAADKLKAWREVTHDGTIVSATCDGAALNRNRAVAVKLGLSATPSIISEKGGVVTGMMKAAELERFVSAL